MRKIKVGLALGSGAARGLAHIGVIKALAESGIRIDVIAGASIGAVVGSLYAAGQTIEQMEKFASDFGGRNIAYWMDPSFFRGGGLLKGEKIEQAFVDLAGPRNFKDLNIPFYAVASDLVTGGEVVLSDGNVFRAVRASFSIPGIFAPVKHGKHWLIDGAVTAPVPTRILREEKCDVIIAVNVCTEPDKFESNTSDEKPKIFEVLMQSLAAIQKKLAEPNMKLADIGIVPDVGNFDWTDFSQAHKLVEEGYTSTLKLVPSIKKIISRKSKLLFFSRLIKG